MRLAVALVVITMALVAHPGDGPSAQAQTAASRTIAGWDGRGWTLLGDRRLARRRGRDVIAVGPGQGAFTQLTVVVASGELELQELTVVFRDGTSASPAAAHSFRDGARTRAIDLPGAARFVREVQLRHAPGRGVARVRIYGGRAAAGVAPGATPGAALGNPIEPVPTWNPSGWVKIGEAAAGNRNRAATIRAGRDAGAFTELTLVVTRSELFARRLVVTFDRGRSQTVELQHAFVEGTRSRAIDLAGLAGLAGRAGATRAIRSVKLDYDRFPTGRAQIEIWGRSIAGGPPAPGAQPAATPVPGPSFDPTGWTLLGEQRVEGDHDRDVIQVRRADRADISISKIVLVVSDADLDLESVAVHFGNDETFSPAVRYGFREGQRSRVIELPAHVRRIENIELRYGNTPGGGKARVEVYGR